MSEVQALQTQSLTFENIGENGFISYINSLSDKPSTTIRFFDRGEYYTVHNEDASFTAKEFFKTTAVIKEFGQGNKKISSVALSKNSFEKYIRELLVIKQYRVELYRSKPGKQTWQVVGKASPGNLQQFEDILFGNNEMSETAVILSLKLATDSNGQKIIGSAFIDMVERKLSVCEFADNDQFSNLQAFIMQIGVKECILTSQDSNDNGEKLKQILERSNVLATERKKVDFNSKDIEQDLSRLLKSSTGPISSLKELELTHSINCLSAIIKYLELLSDESVFNQFTLKTFDLTHYMRLDASAVKALNITPSLSDGGNKSMCVQGLLNMCKTSQGQRLLSQWVKQPLLDKKKIDERLDIVDAFCDRSDVRQTIQDVHLRHIPDMSRLSKKFQRKRATLQDCVRVYQAVKQIPNFVTTLNSYDGEYKSMINEVFAKPFSELVGDFSNYMDLIETTVDLMEVENHEYLIKAEFDSALQECKESLNDVTSQLEEALRDAAKKLNLEAGKTIKLDSNSQLGHFFRITLKEEKILRSSKNFRTLETRKDGVRFTNGTLTQLNDEHRTLKATYNELQSQLANEVIKVAGGYADPMQVVGDTIAYLDVLLSFSLVACQAPIPYTRPKILPKESGRIVLQGSRHPCLEAQDDVAFIANDVSLVKGSEEFLLITGPNMGGKSTYIRQVAVVTLMAQIGSFVSCDHAEVSIVDSIMARVGAGDSQQKGVSTFMSEMLETATILNSASPHSLIIIDELGRGTSTYDGFGLAWAISEHIATQIKSFCLFATHFHELTSLADQLTTVKNYHVTALTTTEKLTLLYRVKPGVCDQSFGIHVAEIVEFPDHVIEFAKLKAKELEDFQIKDSAKNDSQDSSFDEVAAKKRRIEKKESDGIIAGILEEISAVPTEGRSNEDIHADLEAIKKKALSCGNVFVTEILAR